MFSHSLATCTSLKSFTKQQAINDIPHLPHLVDMSYNLFSIGAGADPGFREGVWPAVELLNFTCEIPAVQKLLDHSDHVVAMVVAHHTSVYNFFIVIVFSVYYYSDERGGWLAMHPIHPPCISPWGGMVGDGGSPISYILCIKVGHGAE